MIEQGPRITPDHLRRDAYLYIRQATIRKRFPKRDSLQRQYALHQKAVALGWPNERVAVIDCDLGRSGANTHGRGGFQKLIVDVSEGRVGMVLASDVSRFSRNCRDWHDLVKICACNDTLIFLEDEVYDLTGLDDYLLLLVRLALPTFETRVPRRCLPVAPAVNGSSSV
jgi:DNA invertase Pin-like site-specific DNA recombinase